ncbi:MAG: hypothetical protein ACXVJI_23315 [Mucilaginibacter sp.]
MKAIKQHKHSLKGMLQGKCPHCGKGYVFIKGEKLLQMPVMHEHCQECNYQFDREPGYFLGAMYLSYGFAVIQAITIFLLVHFLFPALATIWTPVFIMLVILIFAKTNYKLSRVMYIHIFPW